MGLQIRSGDLEYVFWWLLDAPESNVELEVLSPFPGLEKLVDQDFQPCSIICTSCGGLDTFEGLPLRADYGHIQLFGLESSQELK